jgi:hypothetical protein
MHKTPDQEQTNKSHQTCIKKKHPKQTWQTNEQQTSKHLGTRYDTKLGQNELNKQSKIVINIPDQQQTKNTRGTNTRKKTLSETCPANASEVLRPRKRKRNDSNRKRNNRFYILNKVSPGRVDNLTIPATEHGTMWYARYAGGRASNSVELATREKDSRKGKCVSS